MEELDLQKLDRDIARAAQAARAWRRTLRTDAELAADQPWFEPVRYATTRATFAAVSELASENPLREPLMRWVHSLALMRIGGRFWVDVARAWQSPAIELDAPERGAFSARDIVHRALSDREPARARSWLDGLAGKAAPILSAEKRAREAQIEISTRLGITDPSSLAVCDRDLLRSEGEHLLAKTGDLASSRFGPHQDLAGLLPALVARDVPGVWPTRVDARWLSDLFRATPLLQGISPDLGPTPSPLGASSFARGLARFGAAYARAAVVAGGAWFVQTSDPSDLHPLRRGALFAWLLLDPVFLRQKLGLSRDAARDTARILTTTALASVRLVAARSLVDLGLASARQIEETTNDALRVRVSIGLSGALPRPDACASERLLASLLSNDDRVALRNHFDEDWFCNPRALVYLREVDAALRPLHLPKELLEGSSDRLARTFDDLAGA